jgi:HlyD family secretion protein
MYILRMSRKTILCILCIVCACSDRGDVVTPTVKPLMEAVYASGFVVSEDEHQIFSEVDGTITAKLANDGAVVSKDDPIFIIESSQQSARFRIAKENYELALRNKGDNSPMLHELSAAVEASKSKMEFDSVNAVRYTNLWKQRATTRVEYDRYILLYKNARNEYAAQSSRLRRMKDQVAIELQNAANQLTIAGDESGKYIVKSEVDGKVFKTGKEKGELVRRSELLAVVGRDTGFYLQLSVDELDIQRVKEGQSVLVKIDAFPDKIFHATVRKIYPMVNRQQQSLRVDAALEGKLPESYSGLAVEANIVIRQKEKAIVVPKTALLPGDSVIIKTDDGERKIPVTTGIKTLDEVEITEGIKADQPLVSFTGIH